VVKEAEKKEKRKEKIVVEEKIEEDKETKKMDHGQLSKQKKASTGALDHLVENRERQAGEALKTRVKWT
jgi:hypothetical protein